MENRNEPKCCCCGVRLGLGILYVLIFIGGIINIATSFTTGYTGGYVPLIAISVVIGVLEVLSGVVGMISIKKMESRWANKALKSFIALFVITWVLQIINIVLMNVYFDDIVKNNLDNNLSSLEGQADDATIDAIRKNNEQYTSISRTSLIVGPIVSLVVSIVIVALIANRMKAYQKWLMSMGK